ncbi:hypothetical protein [Xenorhabdus stockiae]|uniref:hypothetical protein n=1 Tax=Xenorhabdus stockiae TaxID=351614 RepID=UPI0040649D94
MNKGELSYVLSERDQILSLLKEMPEDAVISRMSLEYRLRQINEELESITLHEHAPAKAIITFKGDPVVGTYGISSKFGSKIIGAFNDAITAIAKSLSGENNIDPMVITGTAKGSFGFVLEEAGKIQSFNFNEESLISKSLNKAHGILKSAISSNDDELSDEIEEIDEDSIKKMRNFIDILEKNKTIFTLKHNNISLIFRDPQQLNTASLKLSRDNIREELKTIKIIFLGVLPNKRQCEFSIFNESDALVAKISSYIENPEIINSHLKTPINARFLCTTVGNGKPKYSLREIFTLS